MSAPPTNTDSTPLSLDARGWLQGPVRHVCSPNCNTRPDADDISLLVIHNISLPPGQFGGSCIEQLFCNCLDHSAHPFFEEIRGMEVSAHFLIDRHGAITQFVATSERAWHAGRSEFQGRLECNDFSIGIELEGTDDAPYTAAQYHNLARLTVALLARYRTISLERIVGHCDIAPERKTDPGPAFDWEKYRSAVRSSIKEY